MSFISQNQCLGKSLSWSVISLIFCTALSCVSFIIFSFLLLAIHSFILFTIRFVSLLSVYIFCFISPGTSHPFHSVSHQLLFPNHTAKLVFTCFHFNDQHTITTPHHCHPFTHHQCQNHHTLILFSNIYSTFALSQPQIAVTLPLTDNHDHPPINAVHHHPITIASISCSHHIHIPLLIT